MFFIRVKKSADENTYKIIQHAKVIKVWLIVGLYEAINWTGPKVIKLFSYSTQLSTKFIRLINVKILTIVGILTFISMINTTSERLKARNFFICKYMYFSVYEKLKFCEKSFITLGPESFNILYSGHSKITECSKNMKMRNPIFLKYLLVRNKGGVPHLPTHGFR